eukprot:3502855-Prymnesium_polylepis.1
MPILRWYPLPRHDDHSVAWLLATRLAKTVSLQNRFVRTAVCHSPSDAEESRVGIAPNRSRPLKRWRARAPHLPRTNVDRRTRLRPHTCGHILQPRVIASGEHRLPTSAERFDDRAVDKHSQIDSRLVCTQFKRRIASVVNARRVDRHQAAACAVATRARNIDCQPRRLQVFARWAGKKIQPQMDRFCRRRQLEPKLQIHRSAGPSRKRKVLTSKGHRHALESQERCVSELRVLGGGVCQQATTGIIKREHAHARQGTQ